MEKLKNNKKKSIDMPSQNRVKKIMMIAAVSAIVLIAATYAWFIGLQEVSVDSFEVEIASSENLLLSLNGRDWSDIISFSKDDLGTKSYLLDGEPSYNWPAKGLVPLSTVGDVDSGASEMKFFEKASLTATPGGYRLLAGRVNNYNELDTTSYMLQDGYVAFDLFIKNYSGTKYIQELNEADEEAIYLTTTSSVLVGSTGTADTGIENSVRVAFAPIGRVNGFNGNQIVINTITCNTSPEALKTSLNYVTGICRKARIWEPNDTKHVQSAINWYQKSCLLRTGNDITELSSYTENSQCNEVVDGNHYQTYAIADAINSSDNIDVYDGVEYNGYVQPSNKTEAFPFFTDTQKLKSGIQREGFFTLSPNSITKMRVYVYIEGQDIDNYDFAAIGKQIQVNFGFTKQRFTEEDVAAGEPEV